MPASPPGRYIYQVPPRKGNAALPGPGCFLTAVRRTKVGYIARQTRLRVPGLDPEASYRLTVNGQDTGLVFPGDVLGVYGLWTNELPWADCVSAVYLLERV